MCPRAVRGSPGACFWWLSGTSGPRPSLFSKQPIGAQAATAAHGRAGQGTCLAVSAPARWPAYSLKTASRHGRKLPGAAFIAGRGAGPGAFRTRRARGVVAFAGSPCSGCLSGYEDARDRGAGHVGQAACQYGLPAQGSHVLAPLGTLAAKGADQHPDGGQVGKTA